MLEGTIRIEFVLLIVTKIRHSTYSHIRIGRYAKAISAKYSITASAISKIIHAFCDFLHPPLFLRMDIQTHTNKTSLFSLQQKI